MVLLKRLIEIGRARHRMTRTSELNETMTVPSRSLGSEVNDMRIPPKNIITTDAFHRLCSDIASAYMPIMRPGRLVRR